jgi:flagellar basal body-associated protein FliL
MLLTAAETASSRSWPDVILIIGILFVVFLLVVSAISAVHENRKLKVDAAGQEAMRQLVDRYEQLAEKTMDAQQRIATDVAELRSRTAAVEQILRSVE